MDLKFKKYIFKAFNHLNIYNLTAVYFYTFYVVLAVILALLLMLNYEFCLPETDTSDPLMGISEYKLAIIILDDFGCFKTILIWGVLFS